jgi:hypothetical protein
MALRIFGFWTILVALIISGVAAYYSIIGLVAIFAAAAVPIIIMGAALEVGKLTTAVWLHTFWDRAHWGMKYYLSFALVVLMFITSMGIFGFLSKAHIEQTSATEESVEQTSRVITEIARLEAIIARSEIKVEKLENTDNNQDANIQAQIDKEQVRIDKAFDRIKPAVEQQNKIITDARATDNTRTKPYEDQLTSIQAEILRLETSAKEYEGKISTLGTDNSGVEPLLAQITALEDEIIRVTNQLQSTEQGQVRAGQAIIGVTSDGLFGGNTRTALAKWVSAQRDRITQIQGEVATVRAEATKTVKMERFRLAGVVKDIREVQIPALKERELVMLGKIDEVRQTESPVIQTARDEIQRLRTSAETAVANSQTLINQLRSQLGDVGNTEVIDGEIAKLNTKIKESNDEIDNLTEEKYALQAEFRKLEAEVGPVKYIAEFVYGEADKNILEEAVRWVILILVLVFDPLAVVLVLGGITLIKWKKEGDEIPPPPPTEELLFEDVDQEVIDLEFAKETTEEEAVVITPEVKEPVEEEKVEVRPVPVKKKAKKIKPKKEEKVPEIKEEDKTDYEGLYEDTQGFYTVDASGARNYSIDPDQEKLNRKAKQIQQTQKQIDKVVTRMKEEGRWPNPPTPTERPSLDQILESDKSGELEKLLDKADDDTLAQVYQAILSDMKIQPNRKSE